MKRTRVVNLNFDLYDVYIGRAGQGHNGYFGNPFRKHVTCSNCLQVHQTAGDTLPCFESYFLKRIQSDSKFRQSVLALRGKTLGCFCAPLPCHGTVIAKWVDSLPEIV